MKLNLITITLTFLLIGNYIAQDNKEKYALLVGVTDYPKATGWKNLATLSDIDMLEKALLARGFRQENILRLTDKTTKKDIQDAFFSHLIGKVAKGDVVFFHFSGHGYQIPDDNGDELDGWDEALVPSNATTDNGLIRPDNFYVDYIRDDEFGKWLDELRAKLGKEGNVMVSIDACHSGTATRGTAPYRGAIRGERKDAKFQKVQGNFELNSDFGLVSDNPNYAPMACFFASSQDQLNKEYHTADNKSGSLSFALSTALMETPSNVSYRALFDQVRTTMSKIVPGQMPHLEGDDAQEIFGGKLLKIEPYWSVTKVEGKSEVLINAGSLMYLKRGTKVAFYAPDTQNFREAQPIASGEVTDVKTIESTIRITGGEQDASKLMNAWIYITDQNFGGQSLTVRVEGQNKALVSQFENFIKDYPFIQLTKNEVCDVLLEVGIKDKKKNNHITVTTREDVEVYQQDLANLQTVHADSMLKVIRRISDYSQSMFLRTLQVDNYEFDVDIRIVPLQLKEGVQKVNRPSDLEPIPGMSSLTLKEAVYELPENTFYKLEIINNSSAPLYYSIIEIDPIHKVNVLFPQQRRSAQEYKLNPRSIDSPVTGIFKTDSTYGSTVYKLVVTRTPLDLRGVFQTRGVNSRGSGSPFETLLQSTFKEDVSTRSSSAVSMEVEDVGVYTFVYELVKKK
jgi:metacaspase-1